MIGITPICPYCKNFSRQVTGKTLYPHRKDLHKLKFYQCVPCDAYVGCHGISDRPLGRLANCELRSAKSAAHRMFDAIWKNSHMSRSDAYSWLSRKLGIAGSDTHIGMFDVAQCERTVECSREYLTDKTNAEIGAVHN